MRHTKYIWLHLWLRSVLVSSKCDKLVSKNTNTKLCHKMTKRTTRQNSCSHHHITINMVNLNVEWTFIFAILASSFHNNPFLSSFCLFVISSHVHTFRCLVFSVWQAKSIRPTVEIRNNGWVIAVVCSYVILSDILNRRTRFSVLLHICH